MHWVNKEKAWLLPIFLMILITPFTSWLDLSIARAFYKGDKHFTSNEFTYFIYNYGTFPAYFLAFISLSLFGLSFFSKSWMKWRRPSLVLILTLMLGAGFITHTLLKDHWGRPRPRQVIEFGGMQPFRPFYQPNFFHQPEPSKSFTCGHCTMGFFFFALALVGKRLHNKPLFWTGIFLALVLGILLSLARIAQGGHFLSDTLMTALVMWLTAYACDWLIYERSH